MIFMCEPLKSGATKLQLFRGFLHIPIFSNLFYFTFFPELLQHLIISSFENIKKHSPVIRKSQPLGVATSLL